MARRTKEEAEQTKKAILDSAYSLFCEKGFVRTTFDDIAKRINLTKGAVYWHFRNKADLLAELIRAQITRKYGFPCGNSSEITSIDKLRSAIEQSAKSIENDEEFCNFLFFLVFQMEWSKNISNHISQQIHEIAEYPRKSLNEILTFLQKSGEIHPNINIDDLTVLLVCTWMGLRNTFIAKRYPMSLSRMMLQAFDLIMDGIKVEKK